MSGGVEHFSLLVLFLTDGVWGCEFRGWEYVRVLLVLGL